MLNYKLNYAGYQSFLNQAFIYCQLFYEYKHFIETNKDKDIDIKGDLTIMGSIINVKSEETFNNFNDLYKFSNLTYLDNNNGLGLAPGAKYCYRLVAVFPLPKGGESYISKDTCIGPILADAPVITHVTVDKTGANDLLITKKSA